MLSTLLQQCVSTFVPVVPFDWHKDKVLVLDFTAQNTELEQVDLTNTSIFNQYVFDKINRAGAVAGVGGYNEHRWIYRRSEHFQQTEEPRCIHLGIDIWAAAGTPVLHLWQAKYTVFSTTIILEITAQPSLLNMS